MLVAARAVSHPWRGTLGNLSSGEFFGSVADLLCGLQPVFRVPLALSEHGVGTDNDEVRARFIPAALVELKKAIDDGVPVKGYCHWSLIDNFEWIFGYKIHFGLHSVDRDTFARTAKSSAAAYSSIVKKNAI